MLLTRLKAVIRLIINTIQYILAGLEQIFFEDQQVTDYSFYTKDFDKKGIAKTKPRVGFK